ncbi:DUF3558 family protein [Corynebacterium sp. S7]
MSSTRRADPLQICKNANARLFTRGRNMKSRSLATILACAIVIAGCSPPQNSAMTAEPSTSLIDDSTAASSTSQESAGHAFHFQSGVLPIGDFNPEEVYPNVFNPCEEISAEEFAAIGYEVRGETQSRGEGSLLSCGIRPLSQDDKLSITVSGNLAPFEQIKSQGELILDYSSEILPEIFHYRTELDNPTTCRAAISTSRGIFSVDVDQGISASNFEDVCRTGTELLEHFYKISV